MLTKFGAMVVMYPDKARVLLRRLLKLHGWSSTEAALDPEINANAASVKRWINRLGLRAEVESERVRIGRPARGGRYKEKH